MLVLLCVAISVTVQTPLSCDCPNTARPFIEFELFLRYTFQLDALTVPMLESGWETGGHVRDLGASLLLFLSRFL
jgi:hypothetical protein